MKKLIHTEQLSVGFHNNSMLFQANGIEVCEGDIIALIGLNGAGKSSLLKTLSGFMPCISGQIFIQEREIYALSPKEIAQQMSMVFSENSFPGYTTVRDYISFGRYPHMGWLKKINNEDHQIIDKALAACHLTNLESRYLRELSDGEKQRAVIARSVVQDVDVCLMDEPVAHLDTLNKNAILELIFSLNTWKSVVFSTHHLEDTLQYCNKYWLIHNGEFQVLNREQLLESTYVKETYTHVKMSQNEDHLNLQYHIK